MRLKQVILALFIVRFCVNISLSLLRFGIMVVREKNCYYAIALTDFFVFLSCAEQSKIMFHQISFSVETPPLMADHSNRRGVTPSVSG